MKYLKTFEDYQGQINAGNTANSAPMNVNQPMGKQQGIGDVVMFWQVPNSQKPKEKVQASGKILSFLTGNNVEITLNVEGSDFNKPGVRDENNTVVTISVDQLIGPYVGLRNPTGSGFVSSNTNMDVVAKGSGVYAGNDGAGNFGATDVSNDMRM